MFEAIDTKKLLLDQRRPLPVHTFRSIREHLIVNWTYHSNAIEGNTLTLSETKVVLEGITVGGKPFMNIWRLLTIRKQFFMSRRSWADRSRCPSGRSRVSIG